QGRNAAMMVPELVAREDLHEAHATLHKAASDQAARAKIARGRIIDAVQFLDGVAFIISIERLGGGGLHPRRQLKPSNARLQVQLARMVQGVGLIELIQKAEKLLL